MAQLDLEVVAKIDDALTAIRKFTKEAKTQTDKFEKATEEAFDDSGKESAKFRKKATGEVEKFSKSGGKDVDTFGKKAGEQFTSLQVTVAAFAAAAVAALAAFVSRTVIDGIGDVIEAATIQEDAISQLNQALVNAGTFSEETSQSFQDFASGLQDVTTFGDEALLSQLALARQFVGTDDDAKNLVKTATDLSVATGVTLESAVRNLGKTYGGLTGELGEVVPELKNLTEEQLRSGEAVDLIANKFEGFARNQAQTFSGSLTQAENDFGDLLEVMGSFITENTVVQDAISESGDFFDQLSDALVSNGDEWRDVVTRGVKLFISGINATIQIIPKALAVFSVLAEGLVTLETAFRSLNNAVGFLGGNVTDNTKRIAARLKELVAQAKSEGKSLTAEQIEQFREVAEEEVAALEERESATGTLKSAIDASGEAAAAAAEISEGAQKRIQDSTNKTKEVTKRANREKIDGAKETAEKQGGAAKQAADEELKVTLATIDAITKARQQALKDFEDLKKQERDLAKQALQTGISDPLGSLASGLIPDELQTELSIETSAVVGSFAGALTAALQGEQGALSIIQTGLGTIADTFIPGIGGAVSQAIGILAEGPEAVRQRIDGFADALPDIIKNIANAIPAVITGLAENADKIILALAESGPILMESLANESPRIIETLVRKAPDIARAIARSVLQQFIPVRIDPQGIQNALDKFGEDFAGFRADTAVVRSNVVNGLREAATQFGEVVSEIGPGLRDFTKEILQPAFGDLADELSPAIESVRTAGEDFGVDINDSAIDFEEKASSAGVKFGEKIDEAGIAFNEGLTSAFDTAIGSLETSAETLATGFGDAIGAIVGGTVITDIQDSIKGVFDSLAFPEGFFNPLSDVLDPFISSMNSLVDKIEDLIDSFSVDGGEGGLGGIFDDDSTIGAEIGGALGRFTTSITGSSQAGGVVGTVARVGTAIATGGLSEVDEEDAESLGGLFGLTGQQPAITNAPGPQTITVNLRIGEKELANVILDLERQGYRLRA